ncbi:ATP-binding cassette sub-family D member 3 [Trichoplax sp. H2]|nr:ATP-binding cassette sub-family D member 3 [Trichoplax sp. H2]|eukprot:RDD42669.1 ATP-binding cassette sub-family D member 3 [Trichoplax sp. H2]
MAAISKLVENPRASAAVLGGSLAALIFISRSISSQKTKSEIQILPRKGNGKKELRVAVNLKFFRSIASIFRILVPKLICPESGYMVMVAISLVARTACDVWMISNGTSVESSIIGRNYSLFLSHLTRLLCAMPIISIVNNALKYSLNELKLRFRERLSNYLYQQYLNGFTYYKMSNIDNRIANADQLLTQDVERFCESVTELYSNISKPLLDIIIYARELAAAIGAQGPGYMLVYLAISGLVLTRLRRPISRMTVTEQKLEGEYRFVNSRLITNSEEIAFYGGNEREKITILATFHKLMKHLRNLLQFRYTLGLFDNIIAKYMATVVGYLVVSRPFLNLTNDRFVGFSHNQLLEEYYRSGRMLVRMAEAIGRLVLAGRELTRLAGFTARITELMTVLKDLNNGLYERTMVTGGSKPRLDFAPGNGKIVYEDHIIRFEDVPLVTPNADLLVDGLNFEVKSGQNVLVCGPNGCGKSSLFRILGELWPLFGGVLVKPEKKKLFYVPQRPYMTIGSLRDQIIYPDTLEDQKKKGFTDDMLAELLNEVQLTNLVEREENGWESVQDWMDVLSGGEKQRVAMARLFYHRPQFAILDECTSAVSVDVEGFMYSYCKKVGITLFTVSHRKSLWKYHDYVLQFDGRGKYSYTPIDENTEVFGS